MEKPPAEEEALGPYSLRNPPPDAPLHPPSYHPRPPRFGLPAILRERGNSKDYCVIAEAA